MKNCRHCGGENVDGARFCDLCGRPFEEQQVRPPTINVRASRGVLTAAATGKSFELQPDREMLIGRGDAARSLVPDIQLDDQQALAQGVSRLHAKILCEGNIYYLVDLNSTNSTYLNRHRLVPQQKYRLSGGEEIHFGRYLTVLRLR